MALIVERDREIPDHFGRGSVRLGNPLRNTLIPINTPDSDISSKNHNTNRETIFDALSNGLIQDLQSSADEEQSKHPRRDSLDYRWIWGTLPQE